MGNGPRGYWTKEDADLGQQIQSQRRRNKIEDYLFLKSMNTPRWEIMTRLGVTDRTLFRYARAVYGPRPRARDRARDSSGRFIKCTGA